MKMKIYLLTKHLLSGNVEEVKIVGSHSRDSESILKKRITIHITKRISELMAKKMKVELIKGRTIMTRLVIKAMNKGIERVK